MEGEAAQPQSNQLLLHGVSLDLRLDTATATHQQGSGARRPASPAARLRQRPSTTPAGGLLLQLLPAQVLQLAGARRPPERAQARAHLAKRSRDVPPQPRPLPLPRLPTGSTPVAGAVGYLLRALLRTRRRWRH
ncbi:hypothetical protein ZWY2020_006803 [Hordeum vulgare]|nr:hypothetical protein ZWY2020_006803 [Hordeum vulgare]